MVGALADHGRHLQFRAVGSILLIAWSRNSAPVVIGIMSGFRLLAWHGRALSSDE